MFSCWYHSQEDNGNNNIKAQLLKTKEQNIDSIGSLASEVFMVHPFKNIFIRKKIENKNQGERKIEVKVSLPLEPHDVKQREENSTPSRGFKNLVC